MAFPYDSLVSDQSAWLFTAAQVRELDRRAIEDCGIPGIQLMKRAGQALFDQVFSSSLDISQLYVFCGSGNNGGDGYIVAGLAARKNIPVQVIETSGQDLKGDAKRARDYALSHGLEPMPAEDWLRQPVFLAHALVIDALLGTGFKGELRKPFVSLTQHINNSGLPVFSADIPSGLEADTGYASSDAIRADHTVTFIGNKLGLFTGRGRALSGDITYTDLEVPTDIFGEDEAAVSLLDLDDLLSYLPEREKDGHKGSYGHVLVIGGDHGYSGAPLMTAEAAARMGAGLVSLATRPEHISAIVSRCPEIMAFDATTSQFDSLLEKVDCIVIGPGLGQGSWGQRLLQKVLTSAKPKVIDADALNLIAAHQLSEQPFALRTNLKDAILTPHPGEAGRLLGCATADINRDRLAALGLLREKYDCGVLLKGSGTLIASNGSGIANKSPSIGSKGSGFGVTLCPYGNPGMGTGGMGDVLSGIIAGLLVQGLNADYAFNLAACLHSVAADNLAEREGYRGILATDVIAEARSLLNSMSEPV